MINPGNKESVLQRVLKTTLIGKELSQVIFLLDPTDKDLLHSGSQGVKHFTEQQYKRFEKQIYLKFLELEASSGEDEFVKKIQRKVELYTGKPYKEPVVLKAEKVKKTKISKVKAKKGKNPNKRNVVRTLEDIKNSIEKRQKRLKEKDEKKLANRQKFINEHSKKQMKRLKGVKPENKIEPYTDEVKNIIQRNAAYKSGKNGEIYTGMRD